MLGLTLCGGILGYSGGVGAGASRKTSFAKSPLHTPPFSTSSKDFSLLGNSLLRRVSSACVVAKEEIPHKRAKFSDPPRFAPHSAATAKLTDRLTTGFCIVTAACGMAKKEVHHRSSTLFLRLDNGQRRVKKKGEKRIYTLF